MPSSRIAIGKIARRALLKIAVRVTIVIVASSAIGYLYILSSLESQTREQLEKYAIARTQQEKSLFDLAQDNQSILKQELLRQLAERSDRNLSSEFDRLFVKYPDGVTRNRRENFDQKRQASVFVDDEVTINAEIQRRVLLFYHLANQYGSAWNNRFLNLYIVAPENFSASYQPGFDYAAGLSNRAYEPGEEYFLVSDRKHNPQRKTVWTGIYYDRVLAKWMVSGVTPIDFGKRHVASIGTDVLLDELVKRTASDRFQGAYNIIFRSDGCLIAHPDLMPPGQMSVNRVEKLPLSLRLNTSKLKQNYRNSSIRLSPKLITKIDYKIFSAC
mgnify:CR=1 FL=1